MILYRQHELEWTDQDWAKALANNKLYWVVCTAVSSETPTNNTLEEGRWVGIGCLHGPLTESTERRLQLEQYAIDDDGARIPSWGGSRLFIKAKHRASKQAVEQIFASSYRIVADESVGNGKAALFTTVAGHFEDTILLQYYADSGAEKVDHMSHADCLELYGEMDRLPKDALVDATADVMKSKLLLRFRWNL